MKRFILKLLLFFIPVAAVLVGWEICMRHFPHVYGVKKNVILEKCRKDGEIVFLGSSHTFYGVNTDILPHAYNLSYVSQNILQDLFIFELLVSKPHKLKYVAVPVSLFTFFQTKEEEVWRKGNFVRYWGYPAESFSDNFFILDNIPKQLVYVRKYSKRIRKKGIYSTFHITPTGWGTAYEKTGSIDSFRKSGVAAARRHCAVMDMNNTRNVDAMKKIITLAGKQGIKVILFTPPAHRTYYDNINVQQEQKMRAIIVDISSVKGVYYLDLLRSPDFKNEDFYDPDHMSHKGAKKLALKLLDFYRNK